MALQPGTRLSAYEVLGLIGSGGMGEVYRARDTRLHRDVALKVLPDLFARDPDRLARFEREAQVLATLNHPNIAAIHGLEESNGIRALVLELVEGPTLADRLTHGPIPLNEALAIARQIAEALEAAHEHGVIHRDLKPANVKLRPDGTAKVLDFGLARALDPTDGAGDLSHLPTITSPAMTGLGVVLGTAAYMSPEQACGKRVDKRADIWAFGCVLYEMLTGRRAFGGETVTEVLARILEREPDFASLPARVPPQVARLLRRCLEKDPRRRLRDIGEARFELEQPATAEAHVAARSAVMPRRFWRRPLLLMAGVVALMITTGLAVWAVMRPAPPRVTRLTETPWGPTALNLAGFPPVVAISPDGARLAYVGAGAQQIVVRAFDQLDPIALQGMGTAGGLFFSPDGQWIGFFDGATTLKKVAVTGGPPVTISRTIGNPLGASWSADDSIIFATNDPGSGLWRVSAAGGEAEVLTAPKRAQGEVDHFAPQVLPGGQAVLFTISTTGGPQIAVLDLTTREQKVLIRGGGNARYAPTGHLVYGVSAAEPLRAVAFDLRRLEVVGTPIPVLERVTAANNMSLALDGTLVYVSGGVQAALTRTLVWVDRRGREEALKVPPRGYMYPRLSPDGTRAALDIAGGAERDIWIWDFARETLTRLTFDPQADSHPTWTPNGQRLVFRSMRAGQSNLFWQAADGTGAVERLTENPKNQQFPGSFSTDGTRLVFREETATTGADLMVLAVEAARRRSQAAGELQEESTRNVRPLVQTMFDELNGEISPDGRWLAYQSNESGQDEIYVRPFPDVNSGRWQISTGGGTRPVWARNGEELFYLAPGVAMMSAPVDGAPTESRSTFRVGTPAKLFEGRYFAVAGTDGRTYDVSPDGQRFLMIKVGDGSGQTAAPPSIVVVQHWVEELKQRMAGR
jgi:eukaryotic-like serine/threonine-protein kinase